MAGAWASCLTWASGEPKILAQFEADTGHAPLPSRGRSPLDRMIDDACGFNPFEEYMRAFVPWFNEWI